MKHLDLFSGIGGFAIAAESVWPDVEHTFCEIDPFCQAILKKHWPNSYIHDDIRELNAGLENGTIGLWNGNAPNAENIQPLKDDRIVNPAIQNVSLNGVNEIDHIIEKPSVTGTENGRMKSSNAMEDSASAAEKRRKPFSQSTTSTEKETSNDGSTNRKLGSSSSNAVFHPTTKSFATTAITQKPTGYAHTNNIDLLTGGFPCQPFSQAGKRKGTGDDRHLWPSMLETIRILRPRYVVAENVRGLLSIDGGMVFEQVCLDLEALGYEVQPCVIPACAVNAPHRRDRVWIVAHLPSRGKRCCECKRGDGGQPQATAGNRDRFVADAKHESEGDAEQGGPDQGASARVAGSDSWDRDWREVAFATCNDGMDDGLPEGVSRPRGWRNAALKAYGNAIVPQVAEQILRSIQTWRER